MCELGSLTDDKSKLEGLKTNHSFEGKAHFSAFAQCTRSGSRDSISRAFGTGIH